MSEEKGYNPDESEGKPIKNKTLLDDYELLDALCKLGDDKACEARDILLENVRDGVIKANNLIPPSLKVANALLNGEPTQIEIPKYWFDNNITQTDCQEDELNSLSELHEGFIYGNQPTIIGEVNSYAGGLGSIFRELTKSKCLYDKKNIDSKLRRLNEINERNIMDEKDKQYFYKRDKKEYDEQAMKFVRNADTVSNLIDEMKIQPARKRILKKNILLQKNIVLWGMNEIDTPTISNQINNFIKEIMELY